MSVFLLEVDVVWAQRTALLGFSQWHAFTVLPGVDLVYLVVLENGIEVAGMPGVSL